MARSFADIYDLYRRNQPQLGDMSVQDFSRLANYVTGSQDFAQGEAGGVRGLAKKANYWIDAGINATPVPGFLGDVGQSVFEAFGADPEFGRQVGAGLPRAVANFAPVMVAGALSAPVSVGAGALALTSALSGLTPYADEASNAEILAAFAAPGVGIGAMTAARPLVSSGVNALSRVPGLKSVFPGAATTQIAKSTAQQAAQAGVVEGSPVLQTALNTIPERIAGYIGDVAVATGAVEASNVVLGVKPMEELFTKENILANVFGAIPFSFLDAPAVLNPRIIDIQPVLFSDSPAIKTIDSASPEGAARVVEYLAKAQELKSVKNQYERQVARAKLAEEYADVVNDPKFAVVSRPRREAVKKTALENPQKVQEEILTTLKEIRDKITTLADAESVDEVLATVNAVAETPVRHEEVRQSISQKIDKGATISEAVQETLQAVVSKAEAAPVKVETLRKEVAAEVKLRRAAGGSLGGRPELTTEQKQERQGWLSDFFAKNREAEAVFGDIYKQAESFLPKGLPDRLKTDVSMKLAKATQDFYRKEMKEGQVPFKDVKDKYIAYLKRSAGRAFKQETMKGVKHVDDKGVVIKFDARDKAQAEADRLNQELTTNKILGEKPEYFWQVAKLTTKKAGATEQWRLIARRNIQEISLDEKGLGETLQAAATPAEQGRLAAPGERTVADDILEAVRNPESDFAKELRSRDQVGLYPRLEAEFKAGRLNTADDVRAALSRFSKLKNETSIVEVDFDTPTGVKLVNATQEAVVPTMKRFVVEWKTPEGKLQVKTVEATTSEEAATKVGVPEGVEAKFRVLKAAQPAKVVEPKPTPEEVKEVAEVKAAAEEMTTVDKSDPDYAAWEQVMSDQMVQWVDNLTVDDVISIVKKVPELKKPMMERMANTDKSVETFRKIMLEVARLPENKRILNEFLAQVQVSQKKQQGAQFRPLLAGPKGALALNDSIVSQGLALARMALYGHKNYFSVTRMARTRVWRKFGWLLGPEGKWRFELNDQEAATTAIAKEFFKTKAPIGSKKLGELLTYEKLFRAYPFLKDMEIRTVNTREYAGAYVWGGPKNFIEISNQFEGKTSSLFHEIQHAIQHYEGFARGGSTKDVDTASPLYLKAKEVYLAEGKPEAEADLLASRQWYRAQFGEVEAREVQRRLNLTEQELAVMVPFPEQAGEWLVRDWGNGKITMEARPEMSETSALNFSLESVASNVLRNNGWSGAAIDQVAMPFIQALKGVLPVDGVQFGKLVQDALINGQELLGVSSINGMTRRVYFNASRAVRGQSEQLLGMGFNLAHEIGHHVEQAARNGLLSPEAQMARAKFTEWAQANRGDWAGVLNEFAQTLPKEMRGLAELEAMLKPANFEEFEASAHAIWSMGLLAKRSDLGLFSAISPAPVRTWFQTLAKWGRDLVGAVKTFLYKAPTESTDMNRQAVEKLTEYFQNIRHATNEAYQQMTEASQMFGLDSEALSPLKVSELGFANELLTLDDQTFRPNLVGPTPRGVKDSALDWASRSLVYLEQLALRYPQVANMARAVYSTPWLQKAVTSRAMEPIFNRYDPLTGRTEIDPTRRPLLEAAAGNTRVQQVISDIHRWQNSNRLEFPMQNPRSASTNISNRMDALSPNEKKAVLLWIEGQKRSLKILNEEIVRLKDSDGVHVIGSAINDMVPGKDGYQIATLALKALKATNPQEQIKLTQDWVDMVRTGDPAVDASNEAFVLNMTNELFQASNKLNNTLTSRPWYTPEIRTGSHLLRSYDANGKQVSVDGYTTQAELVRLKQIAAQKGATNFKSSKREGRIDVDIGEELNSALSTIENTMLRKLQDLLPPNLVGKAQDYVDHMNLQSELLRLERAHMQNPGLPTRRLAEGRENLNMVMGWQMYVNMMSRVLANRLARSKMRYELSKPELQTGEYQPQIEQIKATFENYLQRDSSVAQAITKWNAVYHLGFNIPTHFAELTQGLSTVLPQVVFQTGSVTKATKMLLGVSKELAGFYAKKAGGKLMGKDEWQKWGNKDEQAMLEILARRGMMDNHAFLESLNDDVSNSLSIGRTANESLLGRGLEVAGSPLKAFADVSMNIYGSFTRWNSRLSAITGYRLARQQGLSHSQAVESAADFLVQTTFTTGRAGRPPEFYKNSTVGAVLYSLQRYALGWMGMYATHLKGAFGDSKTLMTQQRGTRRQHAKAVATMTLVQFGLAGMLGMPFVGPLLTILEDRLGLDIRGRAYQTLSDIFDNDAEEGGYLADMVMRGSANALLERVGIPADFGARFNLSGLPGLNEFNGFDPGRVFGPTANLANSVFTGVTGAITGDSVALSKSVAPVGLRKAVEYFVHGDAITTKGTRLGLEGSERAMYALGMAPRRIAKQRDAESILERQRNERLAKMNRAADEVARLLQSDPAAARSRFNEYVSEGLEPGMLQRDVKNKIREFARQVAQATVKQNVPKDIRTTVPVADREKAAATVSSMGLQLPPSQMEREALLYNQTLRSLGQPTVAGRVRRGREADMNPWI